MDYVRGLGDRDSYGLHVYDDEDVNDMRWFSYNCIDIELHTVSVCPDDSFAFNVPLNWGEETVPAIVDQVNMDIGWIDADEMIVAHSLMVIDVWCKYTRFVDTDIHLSDPPREDVMFSKFVMLKL